MPINGLAGRRHNRARARIVTAQQDSIQWTANTFRVAPDNPSSSPAAGLTCRYPCRLRPRLRSQFMVMSFAVSRARRPTSASGRVERIEPFPLGKHRPQDTRVLVGQWLRTDHVPQRFLHCFPGARGTHKQS